MASEINRLVTPIQFDPNDEFDSKVEAAQREDKAKKAGEIALSPSSAFRPLTISPTLRDSPIHRISPVSASWKISKVWVDVKKGPCKGGGHFIGEILDNSDQLFLRNGQGLFISCQGKVYISKVINGEVHNVTPFMPRNVNIENFFENYTAVILTDLTIFVGKVNNSSSSYTSSSSSKSTFSDPVFESGNLFLSNGSSYYGTFKDNQMHEGELTYASGSFYKGPFKDNLPDGDGTLVKAKNWFYNGPFVRGQIEGIGILNAKNEVYYGYLSNGVKHGHGTLTVFYPNSSDIFMKYTGDFFNDLPHGKGIFETSEVSYEGQIENGKLDGLGTMIHSEIISTVKIYNGKFEHNTMPGPATITMQNGETFFLLPPAHEINGIPG